MPVQEDRIYKKYQEPTPPSTKWIIMFFVIFMGVTTGNLTSNWITAKIAEYELKKSLEIMSKQLKLDAERAKKDLEQLQIRNARIAEEQRRRREKEKEDAAARERSKQRQIQTCQFWIKEYGNTRSEVDMHHRNNACRDAGIKIGNQ